MAYGSTFHTARRLGAGARLTDGFKEFEVSDYSPATGTAYGWPLNEGVIARGTYQQLPDGLRATVSAR